MAGIGAVGLGAALAPAPCPHLGRVGQVGGGARPRERLADEQPASAGLDRDVHLTAGEAVGPGVDSLRGGVDPAAAELARHRVEGVEGDLVSVHIQSGYDRHRGLL
jgi:hypothetical protein